MPLWVQPGRGGPGSFLFPVARDRLDGGLPAQQQEGGPHEHTPLPRPSPRGLPGPSRLAVVLSPPLGSPPPPPPGLGEGPAQGVGPDAGAGGRAAAGRARPAAFLEDILALCLHRGAPGNMAVTAGG